MSNFKALQDEVLEHFGLNDAEARDVVKKAINDSIWEMDAELPESPHQDGTKSITTTVGASLVTDGVPDDYDHIINIYLKDSDGKQKIPLINVSRQQWNIDRKFDLGNGTPSDYNIYNGNLYIAPVPDQAYTGTIEYYEYDTELVNDGDTCKLTDKYARWEHVIIKGAKAKVHAWQRTDQRMIELSLVKYANAITRFRAWIKRNINKSPNASRVRGWKEFTVKSTPLVPVQFRRT